MRRIEIPFTLSLSKGVVLIALLLAACAHQPAGLLMRDPALATLPFVTVGANPPPRNFNGRVVLVTFISTWCFPCLANLPVLEKLEKDHASHGFSSVLVGMDLEGPKVLEPFAEIYHLSLVVADDRVRAGQTAFGHIRELPTRFLFGRDGQLIVAYTGIADPKKLLALIEKELK